MTEQFGSPPSPERPQVSTLGVSDIRYSSRRALIQNLAVEIDEGRRLPVDVMKAIFLRNGKDELDRRPLRFYFADRSRVGKMIDWAAGTVDHLKQKIENNKVYGKAWPESDPPYATISLNPLLDNYGRSKMPVEAGRLPSFPGGIDDFDRKALDRSILPQAFLPLEPEQKDELIRWMARQEVNGVYLGNMYGFMSASISRTDLDYVQNENAWIQELTQGARRATETGNMKVRERMGELLTLMQDSAYKALSRPENGLTYDDMRHVLGVMVERLSLPTVLNNIRRLIQAPPIFESKVDVGRLEEMGRILLGKDPRDTSVKFHKRLGSVYESLGEFFASYTPNVEAQARDEALIDGVIEEKVIPALGTGGVLVDLGSGTGRLTNRLAEKYKGKFSKFIGLDVSPDNLRIAAQEATKLGVADEVTYLQGHWFDALNQEDIKKAPGLPDEIYTLMSKPVLPDGSVDFVVWLGRTGSHAESATSYGRLVSRIADTVRPGGFVFFDVPDPTKGAYVDNRRKTLEIYDDLHIPRDPKTTDQERLDSVEYVIDSADGKNLYNRYVPQVEQVVESMSPWFDVEVVGRAPIAGELWKGTNGEQSENVYLLARRKDVIDEHAQFQSRLYRIQPALSVQSEDDE